MRHHTVCPGYAPLTHYSRKYHNVSVSTNMFALLEFNVMENCIQISGGSDAQERHQRSYVHSRVCTQHKKTYRCFLSSKGHISINLRDKVLVSIFVHKPFMCRWIFWLNINRLEENKCQLPEFPDLSHNCCVLMDCLSDR